MLCVGQLVGFREQLFDKRFNYLLFLAVSIVSPNALNKDEQKTTDESEN